ncbi:hypothetical protein, partial [Chromohalobacter sp. HP20-39]|uniref:hypothetical protein n=1 Tax=Chromohalobacter sp. HP20-39 TaxID=3079306 RepID=UPI00294AD5C5
LISVALEKSAYTNPPTPPTSTNPTVNPSALILNVLCANPATSVQITTPSASTLAASTAKSDTPVLAIATKRQDHPAGQSCKGKDRDTSNEVSLLHRVSANRRALSIFSCGHACSRQLKS